MASHDELLEPGGAGASQARGSAVLDDDDPVAHVEAGVVVVTAVRARDPVSGVDHLALRGAGWRAPVQLPVAPHGEALGLRADALERRVPAGAARGAEDEALLVAAGFTRRRHARRGEPLREVARREVAARRARPASLHGGRGERLHVREKLARRRRLDVSGGAERGPQDEREEREPCGEAAGRRGRHQRKRAITSLP